MRILILAVMGLQACTPFSINVPYWRISPDEDCMTALTAQASGPRWKEWAERVEVDYLVDQNYADEHGNCVYLYAPVRVDEMTDEDSPRFYPCDESTWDRCCENEHPRDDCPQDTLGGE